MYRIQILCFRLHQRRQRWLVPFAALKVTCNDLVQKTRSDEKGEYHLSLPAGVFHVEVAADGYDRKTTEITVSGTTPLRVAPITLSVASANSNVTVTAEGGMAHSYATTSTKIDTPILEQPFSISTVSQDQLIQQNPQTMGDTLGYTAGAQTLSVNGPGVMAVDTFSLRGAAADEYLDGMRIPQSSNAVQSGPASLQLDPADLLGGLDFQWQRLHSQQGFGIGSTINVTDPQYGQGDKLPTLSVDQRQSQFQGGLYGQEQTDVSHFTVIAGGRVDFTAQDTYDNLVRKPVASQDPNALSGHVGVSYHLAGLAPYFSYSTSFLPTLGADVNGKPYVPSTGSNLEGGVKYQFTAMPLMLRVAGFRMIQHNVLQPNPTAPTTSIQTGEVCTPGVEVQANGTAFHSFDYVLGYTHIKPVNTVSTYYQDKQPTTVANDTAALWLHYTFSHGMPAGLGIGGGTRFTGASWGTVANDLRVPSFTLFDAVLVYTIERWRFAVNAKNIGDRRFVNGCSNQFFCAYGTPRTVIGTASFTF